MKKYIRNYIIIWSVLLALFNVIAFVSPGWIWFEKYTPAFWTGYVFIMVSFVAQLACACLVLKESNSTKLFYRFPIFRISYAGLIVSFVVGGLCMLLSPLWGWVCILVCAITLVATILPIVKASTAADAVEAVDKKVKASTLFIKSLTVDAESLMSRASTPETKAAAKEVYEAVRYSDPMSDPALASAETQITIRFNDFSAVVLGSGEEAPALAKELVTLIEDRNKKCLLLK